MNTTKSICGVTAEIETKNEQPLETWDKYSSIEEMVQNMKNRDVIYKFANVDNKKVTVRLTKSAQAIENYYENEMQIDVGAKGFPQPDLDTDMWD